MKLVIDISEDDYRKAQDGRASVSMMQKVIRNGTSLDKIRAEIDRQEKWLLQAGYTAYNVDIAFDAIKSVIAENEGINNG